MTTYLEQYVNQYTAFNVLISSKKMIMCSSGPGPDDEYHHLKVSLKESHLNFRNGKMCNCQNLPIEIPSQ